MFLQRSAAVVARRAVVSPMARRAFTTSFARCTTPGRDRSPDAPSPGPGMVA